MKIVTVPDSLDQAINTALDAAFVQTPAAEPDRAVLYQQLLAYFDEHGVIPTFTLGITHDPAH